MRPSSQVNFRRMNRETCDWPFGGGPARPGPIKVSMLGALKGWTSLWQHVSLNFCREGEEGEGGGGGGAAAAKKTKEQRRRLRSSEED